MIFSNLFEEIECITSCPIGKSLMDDPKPGWKIRIGVRLVISQLKNLLVSLHMNSKMQNLTREKKSATRWSPTSYAIWHNVGQLLESIHTRSLFTEMCMLRWVCGTTRKDIN